MMILGVCTHNKMCHMVHFKYVHTSWIGASLVAQRVKRLPTMQETRVQSLGREDPLEKGMATHSSTLAWKIPWTEKTGRLPSMGSQSPWGQTRLSNFTFTFFHFGGSDSKESTCSAKDPHSIPGMGRSPGEGNGSPLRYSCLENPIDKGAWWAIVHGVAEKWLRD